MADMAARRRTPGLEPGACGAMPRAGPRASVSAVALDLRHGGERGICEVCFGFTITKRLESH